MESGQSDIFGMGPVETILFFLFAAMAVAALELICTTGLRMFRAIQNQLRARQKSRLR
jgi:hypothetical protein